MSIFKMNRYLLSGITRLMVGVVMFVVMPLLSTYGLYLLLEWFDAPLSSMVMTLIPSHIIFTVFWMMVLGLAVEDL